MTNKWFSRYEPEPPALRKTSLDLNGLVLVPGRKCVKCGSLNSDHDRPNDWYVVISDQIEDMCPECKQDHVWTDDYWRFDPLNRIYVYLFVKTPQFEQA